MTVEQTMALAIAKAKEERKLAKDQARLELLNNSNYVGYLASVEDESDQIEALTVIADELNKMKPIIVTDGTKYGVNIFPETEYIFGPIMTRVIGLIKGSSAMFTDERQAEFKAITGMSHLLVSKARDAIGSPAYYSKGVLANAIPGDRTCIKTAVTAVCASLNIDLVYVNRVNEESIERWFKAAQDKAEKQYAEFRKIEVIDSANAFVIED